MACCIQCAAQVVVWIHDDACFGVSFTVQHAKATSGHCNAHMKFGLVIWLQGCTL